MSTYKITPTQLGASLRRTGELVRKAIDKGMMRAAQRGKAFLVRATKKADKVDQGQFINSFQVRKLPGAGVVLENDAPHAGIIELGARPHPVSSEGLAAIEQWAMRKLGVDQEEAAEIAEGIARKLAHHGQKGTFIFRDSLPTLERFLEEEVKRALSGVGPAGRVKDPKRVAAGKLGWARRRGEA